MRVSSDSGASKSRAVTTVTRYPKDSNSARRD